MTVQTYFQINEEQEQFLNSFVNLSRLRMEIWNYIRSVMLKYRQCWPGQSNIARALGCCRDTVIQAIKFFKEMGWIVSKKRPYMTNLYFIPDIILQLNTRDKSIWDRKVKPTELTPTQDPTLYKIYTSYKGTLEAVEDFEKKVFQKRERSWSYTNKEIPKCLQVKVLSERDQQILANQFSEYELLSAIEDTKSWWRRNNKQPDNIAAFITARAKEYKSKRNR